MRACRVRGGTGAVRVPKMVITKRHAVHGSVRRGRHKLSLAHWWHDGRVHRSPTQPDPGRIVMGDRGGIVSKRGGDMTFHQKNWKISGDVYNVGHDLVLNRTSTPPDVLAALHYWRDDISAMDEISIP